MNKRRNTLCWLGLSALAVFVGCSRSKPAATPAAVQPSRPAAVEVTPQAVATSDENASVAILATGKQLYGNHCASCHGETGDGNGPAARFLYPKPRNFRDAKFRLVTTTNRVPSDDDLMHVINRGMPGSAMFPFAHLSESDRKALAATVRQLSRTGLE